VLYSSYSEISVLIIVTGGYFYVSFTILIHTLVFFITDSINIEGNQIKFIYQFIFKVKINPK